MARVCCASSGGGHTRTHIIIDWHASTVTSQEGRLPIVIVGHHFSPSHLHGRLSSAWRLHGFAACQETTSLPADLHRMLVDLPRRGHPDKDAGVKAD